MAKERAFYCLNEQFVLNITGDMIFFYWNLNLINHHCHKATSDFLDLLYSRMLFPLITRPTRITANKASLVDNIFTKDPLCPSINCLFLYDISDHLPIFSLVLNNK